MKNIFFLLTFSILFVSTGCRREDIRECAVEMPEIHAGETNRVIAALAPYSGIVKNSYVWDLEKKSLTLRYDSMQIAKTNIRMAIEQAGIKVIYPKNTTGRAGY